MKHRDDLFKKTVKKFDAMEKRVKKIEQANSEVKEEVKKSTLELSGLRTELKDE